MTYHNENARSGLDSNETILTPTNVNSSTFGKVGSDAVDGKVDAQPVYVAGVSIPGKGTPSGPPVPPTSSARPGRPSPYRWATTSH